MEIWTPWLFLAIVIVGITITGFLLASSHLGVH